MIKQRKEWQRICYATRVWPSSWAKRFITSLKNLFNPTRGSYKQTNSLPIFSLLNHTLNFNNWRLICVLQVFWCMFAFLIKLSLYNYKKKYKLSYITSLFIIVLMRRNLKYKYTNQSWQCNTIYYYLIIKDIGHNSPLPRA